MKKTLDVYSKVGCGFCDRLCAFLEQEGVEFKKHVLWEDYDKDQFIKLFGHHTTFPRVMIEGEVIGGMKDTVSYLLDNGYVQSK